MSKLTSSQSKWATMPRVLTLSVANFLSVSESVLMEKSCKTWYRVLNEDEKRWMHEYERLYPVDASALVKRLSHGKDKLIAKHLIRANWSANRYKEIKLDCLKGMRTSESVLYGSTLYLLHTRFESGENWLYSVDLEAKDPKATLLHEDRGSRLTIIEACGTGVVVNSYGQQVKIVSLASKSNNTNAELQCRGYGNALVATDFDNTQQPTYAVVDNKKRTVSVYKFTDGATLLSIPSRNIKGNIRMIEWPYLYSAMTTVFDRDAEYDQEEYKGFGVQLLRHDLRTWITNNTNDSPTTRDNSASTDDSKKQQQQQSTLTAPPSQPPVQKPIVQCLCTSWKLWPHFRRFAAYDSNTRKCCVWDTSTGKLLWTIHSAYDLLEITDTTEPLVSGFSSHPARQSKSSISSKTKKEKTSKDVWDLRRGKLLGSIQQPGTEGAYTRPVGVMFSSDCVVFEHMAPQQEKDRYLFVAYLFTDGVEDVVNKIRSTRAKIMQA